VSYVLRRLLCGDVSEGSVVRGFTNYMEVLWGVDNESHGTNIYNIYLVLVSRTVLASVP
jgi:hypothetical protein